MNSQSTAHDIAVYMRRNHAYLIEGIIRIVDAQGEFAGKVNLGKAAGARGNNSRATRPVERAVSLGLIRQEQADSGNCYYYTVTDFGLEVLVELDRGRS